MKTLKCFKGGRSFGNFKGGENNTGGINVPLNAPLTRGW